MAFEALGEPTKFYLDQKNCETSILLILSKKIWEHDLCPRLGYSNDKSVSCSLTVWFAHLLIRSRGS